MSKVIEHVIGAPKITGYFKGNTILCPKHAKKFQPLQPAFDLVSNGCPECKTPKSEAIEHLTRQFNIQPGETIYTKLIHVSRSGMSRVIDLYVIRENEPIRITWSVADAVGWRYDRKREGLVVNGCGTDVGFEAVYNLGRVLFPDFRCIGDGCPSNDHVNYRQVVRCYGTGGDEGVPCFADEKGVYRLRVGVGDEFALGKVCPVCKGKGNWENPEPAPKKGDKHTDGGYALKQRWL